MAPSPPNEVLVFLRSMMRNPAQIGAVLPSSTALAKLMCRSVTFRTGEAIVEVGAGTGAVTRALLDLGVPRDRLFVIELNPGMHKYLQNRFPGVTVLLGDAAAAPELLPSQWRGKVSTVVSSLPLRPMAFATQRAIVEAALAVMAPDGVLVQYTYPAGCPLPAARLGLVGERVGRIFLNVPPAAVWRFRRAR